MKELLIYALEVLVCSAALLLAYSVLLDAGRVPPLPARI